ncbi:hypothetical protein [Microbacterium sp. 77mftsu3.1]|uniref:hypothetical protein n=1 Tax=Microbacterium sp. 77mftsu3.1 TaxID=1761802 RepID=UPI00037CE67F|nr:hypothetical protein [Microbacterium sp. 77mftsu3.1]
MHRPLALPALVVGALLLAGCTPGESDGGLIGTEPESPVTSPSASPAPTTTGSPVEASPTPTPSAEADPAPAVRTAPECTDIASLEWLQSNIDTQLDGPDTFEFTGEGLPGPAAQTAASKSTALVSCTWGIPYSDGAFSVTVLTTTPAIQESLQDALSTSSKYTASESGYMGPDGTAATTYTHLFEDGIGYGLAYAFYDGYWVIAYGTMVSPDDCITLTQKALTATTAINT